ncbi:DMT family transporter [Leptolyngbya sp. PCC 6406]|uniref:DMT family transporter n=1 Tax=Leptolyngbya sp. PCC 6406 TaxID=1173264 RepID=UPI0002ACD4BA|nr:SMR family transporter [Leptolyngbya sp. PCC 6406]
MQNVLILILLVPVSVALNTIGQILLKFGSVHGMVNWHVLGGVTAYAMSTVSYLLVLRRLDVSIAYTLVFGLTIVATTLAGANVFKEQVGIQQWMGVGLVLSGICAIGFGNPR